MATFLGPFVRLQFFGKLYAVEEWTVSMSIASGGSVARPTQAQVDDAGAAWVARMWGNSISSAAKFGGVKAARIGTNGLYQDDSATEHIQTTAGGVPAGASAPIAPQIALAVTFEGPSPRGAAGRGRIYLPVPAAPVEADGRISSPNALAYSERTAALINDLNGIFDGSVIINGPATATGRAPAMQQVVAVRTGRVLDTMRSRRSKMPEEPVYGSTPITGDFGGGGGEF